MVRCAADSSTLEVNAFSDLRSTINIQMIRKYQSTKNIVTCNNNNLYIHHL